MTTKTLPDADSMTLTDLTNAAAVVRADGDAALADLLELIAGRVEEHPSWYGDLPLFRAGWAVARERLGRPAE